MTSKERLERIELLRKRAELLKTAVQSQTELMPQYYETLTELEKVQRIEAGFQSIMTFAQTYFTGDPPHDLLKPDTPSPKFHYELCETLRTSALAPTEQRVVIAAPRSHAKSTIVTNIFPIWCICYVEDVGERYWCILGDKQSNAAKFLDVIKSEFEDNQMLISDFGNLKGPTWNQLEIITSNQVKITAASAGEGLRGLRYGSFRPSLICDDLESDESCSTPDRIDKMVNWFDRTVMPLGDPKKSKYFLVGTVIHYNSLLNQVINHRSEWKAFKFQAIERFPFKMELWNTWESIFHSRDEGDSPMEASRIARDKATQFYESNKDEMHEGAVVLWPERLDLLRLMELRATKRLAFNSEYMNQPIDEDSRVFHTIHFYNPEDINLNDCDIYGSCDPSMGQTKRSDPSAIVSIAKHRKTGVMYVIDADAKRRHPDEIIQTIFRKARIYNYKAFSIESIAFQQFMRDELIKRSAEQNVYLPVKEFKSTVRKEIRIASIEPLVSSGQIKFLANQRDLIEQMEYFPKTSDDVIDATCMCVELVKKSTSALLFGKM